MVGGRVERRVQEEREEGDEGFQEGVYSGWDRQVLVKSNVIAS